MNDLISIIIPVYNVEQYLTHCVDSVINQTYKNLEIILVDDGSTDNSGKICDEYTLQDNRVKVLHKENGGPSYARNKGIEIATGDYIGFVDADDYIDKDMFYLMLQKQKESNADIVCCNVTLVCLNKKIQNFLPAVSDGVVKKDLAMKLAITKMSFGAFLCNKLFKIKIFDNFRLKEGVFYEDYDAGTRLIAKANTIFYISNNLYFYFQGNSNSTTHQYTYSKVLDHFNVSLDVVELCKSNNLNESLYYAKRTLINVSLSLIRKIFIDEKEKEQKILVKEVRRIILNNFNILTCSDIPLKKKIFGFIFVISPQIIKSIRRFL